MTPANNSSAVPDLRNVCDIQRSSDMGVTLKFMSCHSASVFASEIGDLWQASLTNAAAPPQSAPVAASIENHARFQGLLEWVLCAYKDGAKEDLPRIHAGIDELIANINAWGAALSASPSIAPVGEWKALTDVQWMNIVNHDHAYDGYSKDDAVHYAVKATEAKLKEINAAPITTKEKEA